jgi:hypothetical protein
VTSGFGLQASNEFAGAFLVGMPIALPELRSGMWQYLHNAYRIGRSDRKEE